MVQIEKILRSGVSRFISRHTPGERCRGEAFNPSSHPFVEMCFVISGTSSYMVNNCVYKLEPGVCVFIASGVSHSAGYRPEDHDLCHLWLYWNNGFWANLIRVADGGRISHPVNMFPMPPGYEEIFSRRIHCMEKEQVQNDDTVADYLRDPVDGILREVAFQLEHQAGRIDSDDPVSRVIQAVKTHIFSCNARECSYQNLEQVSGFSKSYLAHCFRARTGMSIGDFIDHVRINYTVKGRQQGMTQKEIACELGFSSPVSYWSWLRKHKDKIS